MRQIRFVALTVVLCFSTAASQHPMLLRHRPLIHVSAAMTASQTVRVLGLMVEFQEDMDPRTSGTGRFLTSGPALQIDPPPHDSAYFASKLLFLANYFNKVSNGALDVQGELFPVVVTLPDSMAAYSPQGNDDVGKLAALMVDGWKAADAARPAFPFSSYDAFIVFHAGAGRDIDLVQLLGFDPAPHDIPSITINLQTLRSFLKDPLYPGVPVNGGGFHITNSMILPETETRVFALGSTPDTLQLGINGLLAASFGSYLGLPDLFDTSTGRSGIGQFGLMDGAAIFAYQGVLPPEPSAWEKILLGWSTPVTVDAGSVSLSVPAASGASAGPDTVYKIPVSATEYFLVENRSRDPLGNGQTLSLFRNGQIEVLHFGGDTAGFAFNDLSAIHGSLIDAEDFDWALPGSTLEAGYEGGGILIWHIDESDLAQKLSTNTLNADPHRRTVDLEEADGSQDIGVPYGLLEPGSGTENGWPLDFWFGGNASPVYTNEFGSSTYPDSRANSGFPTFVRVRNFSPRGPVMTALVSQGGDLVRRVFRTTPIGGPEHVRIAVTDSGLYWAGVNGVSSITLTGVSRTDSANGLIGLEPSVRHLAVREGVPTSLVTVSDSAITVRTIADSNGDGLFDLTTVSAFAPGEPVTAGPIIADSAGIPHAFAGTQGGNLVTIRLDDGTHHLKAIAPDRIAEVIAFPSSGTPSIVALTPSALTDGTWTVPLSAPQANVLRGVRFGGSDILLVLEDPLVLSAYRYLVPGSFFRIDLQRFPLSRTLGTVRHVVPTDLDRDGVLDVLVAAESWLLAVNERGFLLDGYPVQFSTDIATEPLVADVSGDGKLDVIVLTTDGVLHALSGNGRLIRDLSLQVSGVSPSTPALFRSPAGDVRFAVSSGNGGLDVWEIARPLTDIEGQWLQERGSPEKVSASMLSAGGTTPLSDVFLPRERVYNWPNPVYGQTTRIRYYTSDPARISVTIMTLAGRIVAELQGTSSGGADEELSWDVSGIDSGVYLARIEAVAGGKQEAVVIKIAVVK